MGLLGSYGKGHSRGVRVPRQSTCCSNFCSLMAESSSHRTLREMQAYGDRKQGSQVAREPLLPLRIWGSEHL